MKYQYWFANIQGISCKKKLFLLSHVKSAEELYYIEEMTLKKWGVEEKDCHKILQSVKEWKLEEEYEKLLEKQVKFYTIQNPEYPERLRAIPSPPFALYVKGQLPEEDVSSVAIVGARECSPYGREMARHFSESLADAGFQVISGMARGIDGASHRGALSAGGTSFGVLGCGVDICYPRENIELYMGLQKSGGIISELPLGMQPLPQFFPARNRIISGLADVVLVIEAKEKSGSLITADMALEQGKDVYALPGPVNSRLSKGCHNLIRQGAGILLSPKDLLEELGIFHKEEMKKMGKTTENKISLESPEKLVYSCLDFQPKSLSDILGMTGLSIPPLLNALIGLELKGYVKEISKNYYVKVK